MKSFKQILLAVFIGMAVVSTAYAEPYIIWKKGTTDPEARVNLRKSMEGMKIIGADDKMDTSILAEEAYKLATSRPCYSDIAELNNPEFNNAFQAEWKVSFLNRHNLNSNSTWESFVEFGKDNQGYVACGDSDHTQWLLQNVQNQVNSKALIQEARELQSRPMSTDDRFKLDAIFLALEQNKSDTAGNTAATNLNTVAIKKLQGELQTLRGKLDQAVQANQQTNARVDQTNARIDVLEERIDPIEKTAEEAKKTAGEAKGLVELANAEIAAIWERVKNNEVAVFVIGIVGLLLILLVLSLRPKKEKKPRQMTGGYVGVSSKPAQANTSVLELKSPVNIGSRKT